MLGVTLLLSGCGGGDLMPSLQQESGVLPLADGEAINDKQYFRVLSPTVCTQAEENRFVYQVMHDSYLWAERVPELDFTDPHYSTPQQLLEALKSPDDRFSFIMDTQEAESYFDEGKNENFGFAITLLPLDQENFIGVVTFVYPNSPAAKAGIHRSERITHIQNIPLSQTHLGEIITLLQNQSTLTFGFEDRNISLSKQRYDIETILYHHTTTIHTPTGEKKVGYMVFQDFIETATEDIDLLFSDFKSNHIDELVLDLRYNGGGEVEVARHLASLIGGVHVSEKVFHHVNLNERYAKYNFTSYFEPYNPQLALNLERIFVITTHASCSASELIINALRASANHIEVVQIGTPTCGKPYGFIGAGIFCNQALYAINMETKNSDNVGGYVNGLSPTCIAEDDVLQPFGSTHEASLAQAYYYIAHHQCENPTKAPIEKKTLMLPRPINLSNGVVLPRYRLPLPIQSNPK